MLYAVAGLVTGIVVGLTGVGGGSLMTPILVLLFGVSPASAVGTDLLYAAMTKSVGTLAHGFQGSVVWRITGLLAAGSVPSAALTILALHQAGPLDGAISGLIVRFLGYALIITAAAMLARPRLNAMAAASTSRLSPSRRAAATVAVGAVLGVFVTLSSVGAGALGVTALILLYPEVRTPEIVGSDIAHAVPLTLVAGLGHWLIGSVQFGILGLLLLGSIPGILLGSLLSPRLPDRWLRGALAAVLLLVGGRLAFF